MTPAVGPVLEQAALEERRRVFGQEMPLPAGFLKPVLDGRGIAAFDRPVEPVDRECVQFFVRDVVVEGQQVPELEGVCHMQAEIDISLGPVGAVGDEGIRRNRPDQRQASQNCGHALDFGVARPLAQRFRHEFAADLVEAADDLAEALALGQLALQCGGVEHLHRSEPAVEYGADQGAGVRGDRFFGRVFQHRVPGRTARPGQFRRVFSGGCTGGEAESVFQCCNKLRPAGEAELLRQMPENRVLRNVESQGADGRLLTGWPGRRGGRSAWTFS